ncbi:MAG: UDP-N-acetylglucosamine 1-carboxyvinyltransferase [Planctomycetes bacterium]|nr:UDP-N-acetylglucosamine 1-carboxyvinyltransferase [Planctomycetota bacterium]
MDKFVIHGGRRLSGAVKVNGSKNACLPIMAAAILSEGACSLHGVPHLADIDTMSFMLGELGVSVNLQGDSLGLLVEDEGCSHARYDLVRKMRASICVLGPLLAKRGCARVAMPGGCAIGPRPIDLHLRGLKAMGAEIELHGGDIIASSKRLRGAEVFMGGPFGSTVLGTANIMMAATLAVGTTVIECAACEPELSDLAAFLNAMGARVHGAGTPHVVIEGVEALRGCEHTVIPDRIEAGTFMCAAAITNGQVHISPVRLDHMMAVVDRLRAMDVIVEKAGDGVEVSCARRLAPVDATTQPYPGFPTDLQAQLMALVCLADGNSVITEKIFPDRFMHVAELARMGAQIHKEGPTVIVTGCKKLAGAPVMASDLRASAALVLAGLAADGETVVNRVYHIDRGYERIERRFAALGADVSRISD